MNPPEHDTRPPSERIFDHERMIEAMRLGVRRALRRHKLLGNPIAVWQDGKVVWIQPADIPVDVDDATLKGP